MRSHSSQNWAVDMKQVTLTIAVAVAVLASVALIQYGLHMRAYDFWMYGKMGVGTSNPNAPVYSLNVWGISENPTFVRLVRFPTHAASPTNSNEVAMRVAPYADVYTRNVDRWKSGCVVLAGRSLDEEVAIKVDGETARRLFEQPGNRYENYGEVETLWNQNIAPHLPAK